MNEDFFMKCRVYAWLAWATMFGLFLAGAIVMLVAEAHWRVAGILLIAALATSAVAATLHIRSFMVRVCALVRAASVKDIPDQGLRPVV